MYRFELINIEDVDIDEYYGFEEKSPFTTIPWLKFLMEDNDGEAVIVRITDENNLIGYFTGMKISRFGVKIVGSPFKGWATCYMGFDLYDYDLVKELLDPVIKFLFKKTGCCYIEIADRHLYPQDAKDIKYPIEMFTTLEIPIYKTAEEFLSSITSKCRRLLNQFERRGAVVERAEPDDAFAEEMYSQMCEVFEKQNLVPTFSLKRIKLYLKHLKDSGMLYCYVVKDPEGRIIASVAFNGFKKKIFGWSTASHRKYLNYRPNEYMVWHALREFRDLGYEIFDYAGAAPYKYKWNPREVTYLRIIASKIPGLLAARNLAQFIYWKILKIRGMINKCENNS